MKSSVVYLFVAAASLGGHVTANAWGGAAPSQPSGPTQPDQPEEKPEEEEGPEIEQPNTSVNAVSEISAIAAASSCAKYKWKDRSAAPEGYMAGMAITFAKSLCRQRAGSAIANFMAQRDTGNDDRDAFAWYEGILRDKKLDTLSGNAESLRTLYTLGIGLGMRESSGKYCEGYDRSAGAQTAPTAEAGMFQFSFNSISGAVNAAKHLRALYKEYKANPAKCRLEVFKKGVTCDSQSIITNDDIDHLNANYDVGKDGKVDGAVFQSFAKSCPAFAAEYAMTTLRDLRKHYGPIVRYEAEVNTSCNQMLDEVQDYVVSRSVQVCEQL